MYFVPQFIGIDEQKLFILASFTLRPSGLVGSASDSYWVDLWIKARLV